MVIGVGILAALALWISFDSWGIGIVHDSVFYLSGADNLSAGRGLTWNAGGEELRPLVHFPPGYSIILAALSDIPASALGAAAAIQIAALATSVVLIGALIFLGSGDRFLAVLGAVIAGASPILFERYLDVRSEPLFLVFLLGSIAVLIRYLETGDNQLLWGAGALTAAAAAFRYAGLAALGSGILTILILERAARKDRVGAAAKFAIIPIGLLSLLSLRNLLVSGTVTNRILAFHPPSASVFRLGAVSISEWILPASVDPIIRLAILAAIVIAAVTLVRQRRGSSSLLAVLAVYALTYSVSLIISLTFFDASIRLDNRILVPLYIYFLIAVFTILGQARVPAIVMAIVLIPILVIFLIQTADLITTTRNSGRGFTSGAWQSSPTIAQLDDAALSGAVYSNEALAIYSLLGISSFPVPERTDPVKGGPRAGFKSQLDAMRSRLAEPESALVIFYPDQLRLGMPTLAQLTEGLMLSARTADGAIYVVPEAEFGP